MFNFGIKRRGVCCWFVVPGKESTALLIEADTPLLSYSPSLVLSHLNFRQCFLKLPQTPCLPASVSLQLGLPAWMATPDSDFVN